MFNVFKRQKQKSHNRKEAHSHLGDSFVPKDGLASTLQGELIHIAGKLTDQAFRNGNMNWDADRERMWRFLGAHLEDPEAFPDKERVLMRERIEEEVRTTDGLRMIKIPTQI